MENTRRLPAFERTISEISEENFRVRVLGTVVGRDEVNNSLIMDDGTGKIHAFFANPDQFAEAKEGKLIRVIGKVRKEEELEIDVELIQDMSKLDLGLYEQVKDLSKKLGGEQDNV